MLYLKVSLVRRDLNYYNIAVQMHAHIAPMIEELDGPACGCALALSANMNHKRVQIDSIFLWKIAYHRLGLLERETWNAKREHLEALLFERKQHKRQFGGNKQWSGFIDTDGVAMVLHCKHPVK